MSAKRSEADWVDHNLPRTAVGHLKRLSRRDSGKVRPRVHTSVSMPNSFR